MKKKPITNKVLWIFAVGQFGWSLLSGIISTWLVHLYTGVPVNPGDTNGLFARFISQNPLIASLTLFGVITAVGRVFDAVTDPMVASWSDRAAFKGGRRIPFMKAVAVPFALCTVGVFFLPQTASVTANNTIIFVLLMLFYLFMTIYCTPYNALIAELGETKKNRINVSTYRRAAGRSRGQSGGRYPPGHRHHVGGGLRGAAGAGLVHKGTGIHRLRAR